MAAKTGRTGRRVQARPDTRDEDHRRGAGTHRDLRLRHARSLGQPRRSFRRSPDLSMSEVAITRGLSDSFALRIANHSDNVHNHYRPEGKQCPRRVRGGRAGPRRGDRRPCHAGHGARISPPCSTIAIRSARRSGTTDRKDAPLEEAVALLVRERLTGARAARNAQTAASISGGRGSRRRRPTSSIIWARRSATRRISPACRATSSPLSTWPTSLARIPINRRGTTKSSNRARRRRAR